MTHSHPILDLFTNRRTIRNYKPVALASGDLDRIIDAGRRAPTGGSGQIYSVVRVTAADLRNELASLAGGQQHIRDAAEFFVFCADMRRPRQLLEHRGGTYGVEPRVAVHYGTMEALLLAANMATAAEALGYGSCFIGAILNHLDAIARELRLPEGVLPLVGLTVGVIDTDRATTLSPRLPREMVFHENAYTDPGAGDMDAAYEAMGDGWYTILSRFFGPGGVLGRREPIWLRTLVQQGFEEQRGETGDD